MPGAIPPGLRPAYRAAKKAHWTVTVNGGDHLRWQPPSGPPVFTPKTPHNNGHTMKNLIQRLRRAGLNI